MGPNLDMVLGGVPSGMRIGGRSALVARQPRGRFVRMLVICQDYAVLASAVEPRASRKDVVGVA